MISTAFRNNGRNEIILKRKNRSVFKRYHFPIIIKVICSVDYRVRLECVAFEYPMVES